MTKWKVGALVQAPMSRAMLRWAQPASSSPSALVDVMECSKGIESGAIDRSMKKMRSIDITYADVHTHIPSHNI